MIEYLGILDDGKLIEHHSTNQMTPKEVSEMLRQLAGLQNAPSKVIKEVRTNNRNHSIFYFSQGAYLFFLATRQSKVASLQTQKRDRLHKYLTTVAEMFYEQYDERHFKHVLKYAVEQINRSERQPQQLVMVGDESERLISRTEKLKHQRPKPRKLFSRANKVTMALFAAVVLLVWLYLRGG